MGSSKGSRVSKEEAYLEQVDLRADGAAEAWIRILRHVAVVGAEGRVRHRDEIHRGEAAARNTREIQREREWMCRQVESDVLMLLPAGLRVILHEVEARVTSDPKRSIDHLRIVVFRMVYHPPCPRRSVITRILKRDRAKGHPAGHTRRLESLKGREATLSHAGKKRR